MDNVILIGFMGSGKTTVGLRLSYRLRMPVIDTDKEIEKEQKRTISEIFAQEGEARFRDMETDCLKRLLDDPGGRIISVGGGLPLREENRALLHRLGQVFYLKAEAGTIYERVKHDTTRPLLQCDDPLGRIRDMLAARDGIYRQAADRVIEVDDRDFGQILDEIADSLAEAEKRRGLEL